MTSAQTTECRIQETIPASLEALDAFCGKARRFLQEQSVGKDIFILELLLREVLTNAVVHGSGTDPAKRVQCEVSLRNGAFTVSASDDGIGFDWREAMTREADPEATSGRGMGILRRYATGIRFNEKGNRVELTRRLEKGQSHGRA